MVLLLTLHASSRRPSEREHALAMRFIASTLEHRRPTAAPTLSATAAPRSAPVEIMTATNVTGSFPNFCHSAIVHIGPIGTSSPRGEDQNSQIGLGILKSGLEQLSSVRRHCFAVGSQTGVNTDIAKEEEEWEVQSCDAIHDCFSGSNYRHSYVDSLEGSGHLLNYLSPDTTAYTLREVEVLHEEARGVMRTWQNFANRQLTPSLMCLAFHLRYQGSEAAEALYGAAVVFEQVEDVLMEHNNRLR